MSSPSNPLQASDCHNRAMRHAGRKLNQFYDQFMAPLGLRSSQFSLLSRLQRLGAVSINALAAEMGMDRTTLGRNVLPLQRDGLISIEADAADKRSKQLRLTPLGQAKLSQARAQWAEAQTAFENAFGKERALALRELLRDVATLKF